MIYKMPGAKEIRTQINFTITANESSVGDVEVSKVVAFDAASDNFKKNGRGETR